MSRLTNRFKTYCRVKLQDGLGHLPRKAKRLIFVATLFRIIDGIKANDSDLISKLNSILQISKNDQAWEFPMSFSTLIWRDLNSNIIELYTGDISIYDLKTKTLEVDDKRAVADWFIIRMPAWLRYGSDELLRYDITSLITQIRKLEAA
jgi:hypothetical protein